MNSLRAREPGGPAPSMTFRRQEHGHAQPTRGKALRILERKGLLTRDWLLSARRNCHPPNSVTGRLTRPLVIQNWGTVAGRRVPLTGSGDASPARAGSPTENRSQTGRGSSQGPGARRPRFPQFGNARLAPGDGQATDQETADDSGDDEADRLGCVLGTTSRRQP